MEKQKQKKLNSNETMVIGIIPEIVIYIALAALVLPISYVIAFFFALIPIYNYLYFWYFWCLLIFLISFFINNKRKNEKFYATVLLFIIYVVYLMFTYWTEINRYGTSFEAFLSSLRNNDFNLGYLALIGAVFVGALTSHIKDKITTVKK